MLSSHFLLRQFLLLNRHLVLLSKSFVWHQSCLTRWLSQTSSARPRRWYRCRLHSTITLLATPVYPAARIFKRTAQANGARPINGGRHAVASVDYSNGFNQAAPHSMPLNSALEVKDLGGSRRARGRNGNF
ncbi:hypothetical protein TRIATDRAFT_300763 [Trichoderma atroviride IMI 206040]|uniref:Uncharacterized protein n=1 Tax=Hypocrea atroviridis (strain ATCC 20476 / IMI 206040) TaxID=452589 RepID=G9P241_HYPAI|nr:uncharacterized protein TRIATDRAFT_300763 [Trichoderma atroviride IMI 206040]EHK42636.1 hypothetical protein TRIATDRAFT_300763 [Trichoderma atroviride IMI 206040]